MLFCGEDNPVDLPHAVHLADLPNVEITMLAGYAYHDVISGAPRPRHVRRRAETLHRSWSDRKIDPAGMSASARSQALAGARREHRSPCRGASAGAGFPLLDRVGRVKREIDWSGLEREGGRIAAALLGNRDLVGRRVAIICPEAADFVVALTGCLLGGAIAVPLPAVATRRSAERIGAILATAAPAALIGPAATLAEPWIATRLGDGDVMGLAIDDLVAAEADAIRAPSRPRRPRAPALIQFTSGSTATPRGIELTHANLAANCAAIAEAYELDADSVGLSWLPLHHDMGLVGHVLTTFLVGGCSAIMNPLHFLQSPLSWLRQAGAQRATITSAPNFAYALCVAGGRARGNVGSRPLVAGDRGLRRRTGLAGDHGAFLRDLCPRAASASPPSHRATDLPRQPFWWRAAGGRRVLRCTGARRLRHAGGRALSARRCAAACCASSTKTAANAARARSARSRCRGRASAPSSAKPPARPGRCGPGISGSSSAASCMSPGAARS